MIKDSYFEDPFPIAITDADLIEYFVTYNQEFIDNEENYKNYQIFNKEMDEELEEDFEQMEFEALTKIFHFYNNVINFYVENNFNPGFFSVIPNGNDFFKICKKDKIIRNLLKEMNIDLTHLYGNVDSDICLIGIPFKDQHDLEYFSYILRKKYVSLECCNGSIEKVNCKKICINIKNTKIPNNFFDLLVFGELFGIFKMSIE